MNTMAKNLEWKTFPCAPADTHRMTTPGEGGNPPSADSGFATASKPCAAAAPDAIASGAAAAPDSDTAPNVHSPNSPTAPEPDRARISRQVAAVGIGGNVALSAFKLIAGIFGNSAAMISDAVHSLSDVFATAIAFAGVRMAERDADSGHPYGHERLECVASLILGVILLATGIGIGYVGLDAIATRSYLQTSSPSVLALAAAVISIVVKEAMFWYTRHQARVLNSSAFMADAWHHRSDALSSVGALLGIGAEMLGFSAGDEIASVAIGVIILKVAYDVLKDALGNMTDTPCDRAEERQIAECIEAVEGVVRIDALRTRKFGSRIYVDAEIAADGNLPLAQAHEIAEAAHDAVEATFPDVKHIMIHENPA